jgi:quinol monooxygenase YgiN
MPPLPWKRVQPIQPEATYVVTITKLPLRTYRRIPRIMRATWRIVRQLRRSDGLVGYSLKADLIHKTFWTTSAWSDDAAVAAFARSDVHRAAMTALQPHMDGARIETFTLSGSEVPPTWRDVAEKLTATPQPTIKEQT